jgi:hypothetical protein
VLAGLTITRGQALVSWLICAVLLSLKRLPVGMLSCVGVLAICMRVLAMMQSKSVESRVGYLDSSLMKCLEIGMTMLMSTSQYAME